MTTDVKEQSSQYVRYQRDSNSLVFADLLSTCSNDYWVCSNMLSLVAKSKTITRCEALE